MPNTRTRPVRRVVPAKAATTPAGLIARPAGAKLVRDAPGSVPAQPSWGPDFWPPAVRENVDVWPPLFRERELVNVIRRPLGGPKVITVLSRKHGVGKTVTAQLLQAVLSHCRNDRAVVLDANPGTQPRRGRTVQPVEGPANPGLDGVVQWVGAAGSVVFAPPPGEEDYAALAELLSGAFSLVIVDLGSDVDTEVAASLLRASDEAVVVATPSLDGMYAASACLDWMRSGGHAELADNSVVALNKIRRMPFSDLLNADRHFSRQCREVVRVRWDSRIGAEVAPLLDELRPTTRTGLFELAAAVVRSIRD